MASPVPATSSTPAALREQRALDLLVPLKVKTLPVHLPPPAPAAAADRIEPAPAHNDESFIKAPPALGTTFTPLAGVSTQPSGLRADPVPFDPKGPPRVAAPAPLLPSAQPAPPPVPPAPPPAAAVRLPTPLASPAPAPAPPPGAAAAIAPTAPAASTPPPDSPIPVAQAAPASSPTADRDALVAQLKAEGFKVIPPRRGEVANSDVVRLTGQVPGYPQPVDIFVPATYHHNPAGEPVNIHLHGYLLGGSVQGSVLEKNDFRALLAQSHSTSALVLPHSTDNCATFIHTFGADGRGFDRFAGSLAKTMGVDHFVRPTLSTHSGSGWIGDEIILHSKVGATVGVRAHMDDGFVTPESFAGRWQTRRQADARVVANQGTVVSLGLAHHDGTTMSNGVYYNRTTNRTPATHNEFWTDGRGHQHRRVMINQGMTMPHADFQALLDGPAFKGPYVDYELTGVDPPKDKRGEIQSSPHWWHQNLLAKIWAIPNQ